MGSFGHKGVFWGERVFGWRKGVFGERKEVLGGEKGCLGVKRDVDGIIECLGCKLRALGRTGVLGVKRGVVYIGCLGRKWGALRCLGVERSFGGLKGVSTT